MDKISLVIACYNEEAALPLFYKEIKRVSKAMDSVEFEFVFVDDGSKDKTLAILKKLSIEDERVKYVSLSRNFGKEAAMYAGLKTAIGDYVAIMDADLQDPPELLKEMYQTLLEKEFDCVATRRIDRKNEPPIRSFFARSFYKLINRISYTEVVDGARDYRLMSRQVVDAILSVSEYNRFSKGIFCWVGFNTKWIEYKNVERVAGDTKWSFWKLFKYGIDGIIAFSTAPLVISMLIGLIFTLIAFIAILFIVVRTLVFGNPVGGWTSIICVILLVSGIQLFCIGIIGQYMAKSYLEVKNRPIYIIREKNDNDDK